MQSDRLRIVVTGASGRMGTALVAGIRASTDLTLSGATERAGAALIGQRLDAALVTASFLEAVDRAQAVIDFTSAEASVAHARFCAERELPLIVGTTGLSTEQKEEIAGLATRTPIVLGPNMSVGVNVLFRIAGEVARTMGAAYDVEIVETHHRMKKDAPSGTALRLAEVVSQELGLNAARDVVRSRDGLIGERPAKTVGVQSVRGGDVVGEHTVFYFGDGERLELTHRATSRNNFVAGALRAARWIVTQPPGLYDMMDVLGFSRSTP